MFILIVYICWQNYLQSDTTSVDNVYVYGDVECIFIIV